MNRLSSPESVIEKIAEVHRKIEELYKTVDLIRRLKEKFEISHEEAAAHEARLQEKLVEYDGLGVEYDQAVRRIENLGERLESELDRMLTEFGQENARIREAMKGFDLERTDLRRRFERLDREYTEAVRDTENHMAYLTERLENSVAEIRHRVLQEMDANRRWIESETAWLGDVSDRMQEEADFQKENLDLFKDRIEILLEERTEALAAKHEAHADRMNAELHRLEEAMAEFRDRTETTLKDRTDTLEGEAAGLRKQLADFQQTAERGLNARLSEESKQLRMTVNREIEALAAERKEISSQCNQLIVKSHREITQLGQSATVEVRERLNGMTHFVEESREEFHTLKNRIQEFADRVREKIDRDTATLRQGQSDFKKMAVQKISAKLSDEVRKLRAANEAVLEGRIMKLTKELQRNSDKIDSRLQDFEERITASEAAVEKEKASIKNQNATVRDHLKQFSDIQTAHARTLPALADRIAALEDQLEEIGQRRGLFNFLKNPKNRPPAKE